MAKEDPDDILSILEEIRKAEPDEGTRVRAGFDLLSESWRRASDQLALFPSLQDDYDDFILHAESTSSTRLEVHATDSRVACGDLIIFLYTKLTEFFLSKMNDKKGGEYTILSIRKFQIVTKSFDFAVLTCICPYLAEGVGIPLSRRSSYIKSWTRIVSDSLFQRRQLRNAITCFFEFCSSNEYILHEFSAKHTTDIICANEQLIQLNDKSLVREYEAFLDSIPPPDLISELTALSRLKAPTWFQAAIGARMSSKLVAKNGLFSYFTAFKNMSSLFGSDFPFLNTLGTHLAKLPKGLCAQKYYPNIVAQFISLVLNEKVRDHFGDAVFDVFMCFLNELEKKDNIYSKKVLDKFLEPWEKLATGEKISDKGSTWRSLRILGAVTHRPALTPQLLIKSPRFSRLSAVWMEVLNTPEIQSQSVEWAKKMHVALRNVIAASTHEKSSAPSLMYWTCEQAKTGTISIVKNPNARHPGITEVGEGAAPAPDPFDNQLPRWIPSDEILTVVTTKVNAFLAYYSSLTPREYAIGVMEALCSAFRMWANGAEDLTPRFVSLEKRKEEPHPDMVKLCAHIVYTRLLTAFTMDLPNATDARYTACWLDVVAITMESLIMSLDRLIEKDANQLDVAVHSQDLEQEMETMAGRLDKAAAFLQLVDLSMKEIFDSKEPLVEEQIKYLRRTAYAFFLKTQQLKNVPSACENIREVAEAAKSFALAKGMKGLSNRPKEASTGGLSTSTPHLAEIYEEIAHGAPFERGHAWLVVGKMCAKRDPAIQNDISGEGKLFEKAEESLYHADSYVYLAAVNALAEMTLWDTSKLRDLIALFKDLKFTKDMEGAHKTMNTVRCRVAEVLGRIFARLGDMAKVYLDQLIDEMISTVHDTDEFVRTSALSVLGTLCATAGPAAIGKHLGTIFGTVKLVLENEHEKVEPRRGAVLLLRESIKGGAINFNMDLGEHIRDMRRLLNVVYTSDPDETTRLQAEVAKEEMQAALAEHLRVGFLGHVRDITPR